MKLTLGSPLARLREYLIALVASVVVLIVVFKLWRMDLSVPLVYSNDALFSAHLIKGIIDNGWFLTNNFLGRPAR